MSDATNANGKHSQSKSKAPGTDPADATRKQVSADIGLLELLEAERARIEQSLPRHRWRSKNDYLDLVISMGLTVLADIEPIEDPLMVAAAAAAKRAAEGMSARAVAPPAPKALAPAEPEA